MAAGDQIQQLVRSTAECSMCLERLNNPKYLPCSHTFCCDCIEKLCHNHHSQKVPCPCCRRPFIAPRSGCCSMMPTNIFAEQLVRSNEILDKELEERKAERSQAAEDIRRLVAALTDTGAKLEKATARVEELKLTLSDIRTTESVLHEQLWGSVQHREAVEERQQLQAAHQRMKEAEERLRDQEAAHQAAKNVTDAVLSKTEEQLKQQMRATAVLAKDVGHWKFMATGKTINIYIYIYIYIYIRQVCSIYRTTPKGKTLYGIIKKYSY